MTVPDGTDVFHEIANRYERLFHALYELKEHIDNWREFTEPRATSQFAKGEAAAYERIVENFDRILSEAGIE